MKKKILKLGLVVIFIAILILLTGCGNKENKNQENENQKDGTEQQNQTSQENEEKKDNIEQQNEISQEDALEIVTDLIRPTYSTANIEELNVDITTKNINNETYLNYYNFNVTIGEDVYTLVVNKYTSKIYLFEEDNQNNLQEITQKNLIQYIKITKYTGNGYKISIKDNNNCHLTMDTRAGSDDGEYIDSDGTYIIEKNKIVVTVSGTKKYEFNITNLNKITIIEEEKEESGFGVGTYKAKESDGEYVIEIYENGKCHFQALNFELNINSDGKYTLENNIITFKLNSGETITCNLKNGNQIYWNEQSMTFFKN